MDWTDRLKTLTDAKIKQLRDALRQRGISEAEINKRLGPPTATT